MNNFRLQNKKTRVGAFIPTIAWLYNIFNRNDKSEHITHLDNVVRIIIVWSEWGDSNSRHLAPKCVSEPSASTLPPSLTLSAASAVPL